MEECCKNCRFWMTHTAAEDCGIAIPVVALGLGICRRYPPTVIPNPRFSRDNEMVSDTAYPDVEPHEWCGEFQPRQQLQPVDHIKKLRSLGLSVRAVKALLKLNVSELNEIAFTTEQELLRTKGCSLYTVNEIKNMLAGHGLQLKKEV